MNLFLDLVNALESSDSQKKVILVEGVYSMDGTISRLE